LDFSRHNNSAPSAVAACQSAQLKKLRSAISSQSGCSRGHTWRASTCSPVEVPAIAAATTACEAHSEIVTTRTLGNGVACSTEPP
jgi:hypothetical protein